MVSRLTETEVVVSDHSVGVPSALLRLSGYALSVSVCLFVCLSVSITLSLSLSLSLSVSVSVSPFASVCLSLSQFVSLSLSICLSVCPCLSVSWYIFYWLYHYALPRPMGAFAVIIVF